MDGELRALERRLKATGKRFKVLDEMGIARLTAYLQGQLEIHKKTYTRYAVLGRQGGRSAQAAEAYEQMNNIISLLEVVLDD